MDKVAKMDSHLSSAAAFVEGGIQDACDDACSICLEAFSESDPSTVTSCRHEFHLQCILEWCQRSSQCPMCWQSISLKDPTSQELFEGFERERNIRLKQPRAGRIFHHPAFGDFDLQHLPVGGPDAELEERIIQHLAATAAMGRAHHIARREGRRNRSGSHGRPQFLFFSAHQNAPAVGSVSPSLSQSGECESPPSINASSPSAPLSSPAGESPQRESISSPAQADRITVLTSGNNDTHRAVSAIFASSPSAPLCSPGGESPHQETISGPAQAHRITVLTSGNNNMHRAVSASRVSAGQSTASSQDRPGPTDFQSFSEALKSRLNAVSMRYKESITKSTRGWREKLFSRNSSMGDLGSDVRREINAGIATVSRMMERLDTRENRRTSGGSVSPNAEAMRPSNMVVTGNHVNGHPTDPATSASCVATSVPN